MELELHDRGTLDCLRFHVLDVGDVEEVVFVEIGQVRLHLRRVHATVGLGDVDRGDSQRRKHVAGHLFHREQGSQRDGENGDDDRQRAAEE
jgi:hypothetical protein